jgi:hypothetical protein
MLSSQSKAVAEQARQLYESRLRKQLEQTHRDKYVCIEPLSGDYFLGDSFDEAVNEALDACPGKLTHTLRIGHAAAVHIGARL